MIGEDGAAMFGGSGAALFGDYKPPAPSFSGNGGGRGGDTHHHHYQLSIHAENAESFHKSQRQIERRLYGAVRKGAEH